MSESLSPVPDDQAESSPVMPDSGETLPPSPEDFAQAKALNKFQDAEGMAGATEAMLTEMRADKAKRLEDARTAIEEAEADPNIISKVPWSTEAGPDAAATESVQSGPPLITEVPGFEAPASDATEK